MREHGQSQLASNAVAEVEPAIGARSCLSVWPDAPAIPLANLGTFDRISCEVADGALDPYSVLDHEEGAFSAELVEADAQGFLACPRPLPDDAGGE
jgi:hypothetical protein